MSCIQYTVRSGAYFMPAVTVTRCAVILTCFLQIIISFFALAFLSKKFMDRQMLVIGLFVMVGCYVLFDSFIYFAVKEPVGEWYFQCDVTTHDSNRCCSVKAGFH